MKLQGECRGVVDAGKGALLVLVENELDGDKHMVAARCWGKVAEFARKVQPGSRVYVEGRTQSREYNGRWYTDFNVRFVEIEEACDAPKADTNPPAPPPSEDDIPF